MPSGSRLTQQQESQNLAARDAFDREEAVMVGARGSVRVESVQSSGKLLWGNCHSEKGRNDRIFVRSGRHVMACQA